jgi:Domain of unknown function (DUF1843)
VAKASMPSTKQGTVVPRPVYDPGIREVMAEGDLAKMKRVYAQAQKLLEEQGNLRAAVNRLGKAIKRREAS